MYLYRYQGNIRIKGGTLFCSGRSILFIDQAEGNTLLAPEEPPVPSIKEPEQVFSIIRNLEFAP
ncbi:MAG: hypothetical protein EA359_04640 [Balneolaceae bacterium]|nr:MAG: hypothetical protein EA359_04640 [Balneolaceae bacterium]